ncbi:MAG: YdcF family protein [Deinococcota bacterium]
MRFALLIPALMVLVVMVNAVNIWTYPSRAPERCPAETLLVMGAAQYNGTPSPAFQRRLDKAFELYQAGCTAQIVVSGGKQQGDLTTEGEAGVAYLKDLGVPELALTAETQSETSVENLRFSRPYIENTELLIVTDDMHAYRTWWLARHLGLDAVVSPVRTRGNRVRYAFRELVILTAYEVGMVR